MFVDIEIPNSRRDLDRAPLSCAEAGETKKIVRSQIEGDGLLPTILRTIIIPK
jgi:hypothetical protein